MTAIKQLRWRRIKKSEIGDFQKLTICALRESPDPYVSVMYSIPADPCREYIQSLRGKSEIRVSFPHALNKLLAIAIAESPSHNQILMGNSLYQMEGVYIANIILLPGPEKAMTNIVLDNPHLKSLEQIAREYESLRQDKLRRYERKIHEFSPSAITLMKLFYLLRFDKLIPDRTIYKILFQRGMASHITLSNQIFGGRPGTFTVVRSIRPLFNCIVIHTSGVEKRACVENDAIVSRGILPLTVTYDHRVLYGIHAHEFGLTLERLFKNPEQYL